jgi:hypothetical protein
VPSSFFFVFSVPCVGEEILTIHSCYLRVVAVGAQHSQAPQYAPGTTAPGLRGCSRRRIHTRIIAHSPAAAQLKSVGHSGVADAAWASVRQGTLSEGRSAAERGKLGRP